MIFTAFITQLVRSCSRTAVLVLGPPFICTAKPKIMAATIRGRIARLLHNSVKSGLVKKFTISSLILAVSGATVSVEVKPAGTTGIRETTAYMITAAMAAVTKKVLTVTPMILPAFFMESMLAMAEAMEQKTMGTTMQNIRFRKMVPKGYA